MKRKLTALLLAAAMLLGTVQSASAVWVMQDTEYNEDGTVKSGTLVFSNGGESFDKAKLTYGSIDQWKIDLINAQKLTPRTTGNKELDELVKARLEKVITADMTNYQKLRAVYNDIVANSTYSVPIYGKSHNGLDPWTSDPPKTYLMSHQDACYAIYLLRNNAGVCDEYSAAFVALANAIGFEAYDMAGKINGNGHGWSLVRLGDKYYIFDTQAEQVNIRSNQVRYVNFCIDAAYSTAYVPVEGCLEQQKSYRSTGMVEKTTFIKSEADAKALQRELIAYGEGLELDYYPSMNTVAYTWAMAGDYATRQELISDFQRHLDSMISSIKKNGKWWYETDEYYVDGQDNIRIVATDGICGKVDSRGRPSGGYLSFGLEVKPASSGNGDYAVYLYRE